MATSGRKPLPTALKVLEGDRGKGSRPINKEEPTPPQENVKCPIWLMLEAKNECRLIHRKARRMIVTDTIPDQPTPDSNELETRLMLESRPEKQRVPLILHYLEGFSLEEIAQVQNISVGIVKHRMHQARKTLRVEWNGKEEP